MSAPKGSASHSGPGSMEQGWPWGAEVRAPAGSPALPAFCFHSNDTLVAPGSVPCARLAGSGLWSSLSLYVATTASTRPGARPPALIALPHGKLGKCSQPQRTARRGSPRGRSLSARTAQSPPRPWLLPCRAGPRGSGSCSPQDVEAFAGHPGRSGRDRGLLSCGSLRCG